MANQLVTAPDPMLPVANDRSRVLIRVDLPNQG